MQLTIFDELYEKYKVKKPIRLIELFAGYGSQNLALKYLGVDYESYKICEWNYKSFSAYKYLHHSQEEQRVDYTQSMNKEDLLKLLSHLGISSNWNESMTYDQLSRLNEKQLREIYNDIKITHNLVDISKVKGEDLEIELEREREREYLMTYSFPCFTENQLVLTEKKGYIPFIDLKIGMNVLSHDNYFHKIINFFEQGDKEIIHIHAMQFDDIECTKNHKFYARKMYRKGHIYKRYFEKPQWIEAKDLNKNYYLGNAIITDEIEYYSNNLDFWYVIGTYLGDGWINKCTKDTIICGNENKIKKLKEKFDTLSIKYTINQDSKHCYKLRTQNKELREFILNNIGVGSLNKHIPYEIMALPKPQLESFFNGYLNADGSVINNKIYTFTTVNKNIVSSMVAIINKLFHSPCKVYRLNTKPTHIIEGRIVNQHICYNFKFKKEICKQDKAFYEDGYIWYPIRKIIDNNEIKKVYDIEVEDTHSFVLNNCIVHNCQDLSLAGTKQGMKEGSATRSSLLWQVKRIVEELNDLKRRPNILLMENVPQVHGSNNEKEWKKWLEFLSDIGYTSYYQDLIATDYEIPQTRNRCFLISFLGEYSYNFPAPQPLKLHLKDMLEPSENIDSKYFLSNKMIAYMTNNDTKNYNRSEVFERNFNRKNKGIAATISTRAGERPTDNFIFTNKCLKETLETKQELKKDDYLDCYNRKIKSDGKFGTITAGINKRNEQFIVTQAQKLCVDLIKENKVQENDIVQHSRKKHPIRYGNNNNSPCLTTREDTLGITLKDKYNNLSIRKLTPRECFRLMGVKDEDFDKLKDHFSDNTLFHLAGDSIVVNVLMAIFKQLF